MKIKNKTIALLEIVVVLYSLFLVATLPAIASDQKVTTTASEDDPILEIYGNANEDDTIDMRDITYTARIILWMEEPTDLADANHDGRITARDMTQIGLIILGRESELTLVDSADRIVTVSMPVERMVAFTGEPVEAMRTLKAADKIVGVDRYTIANTAFFPEFSDYPGVGWIMAPDVEKAISLHPDIAVLYAAYDYPEIQDGLEAVGVTVIRLDLFSQSTYTDEIRKLGYIFKKEEEASEFIDWQERWKDTIESKIEGISDGERPDVYFEVWKPYYPAGTGNVWHESLVIAGGNNIFSDITGYTAEISGEDVAFRNPEFIVRDPGWFASGGYDTDDPTAYKDVRDEIMGRPVLANVTAVENENVYILASDILDGPRAAAGIAYMAKWFHPVRCGDLEPQVIHQEYVTTFQGLDFDVESHGVFVYHPVQHPDGH